MPGTVNRRIGLLGGTFDPPHLGHLWMARRARQELDLDEVRLIPAWLPPHKNTADHTPFEIRFAMAGLLASEDDFLTVSDIERELGGISYTLRTLRHLKRRLDDNCRLFLIIGGDSLDDIETWRDPDGIFAEVEVVVLARGEADLKSPRPCRVITGAIHPAQSRVIRDEVRAGGDPHWLTPAVKRFLQDKMLYLPEGKTL